MHHLFRPKFRVDECLEEIRECLECGWTGLGYKTLAFEKAFLDYTGLSHCHFLNSCTSALHLALHILKRKYQWKEGDFILSTPLTFVSTNMAIKYEGLTPLFCDVDEALCMDPEDARRCLNAHSERIKGILFVGIGGNVGQLQAIKALSQEYGIPLILDAAHMCGTRVSGIHVDPNVEAVCFSFQAVKNLPTADSGAICFREASLDAQARQLAWLGIDKDTYQRTTNAGIYKWKYQIPHEFGFKYHGNSVMAALALVGLKYLDRDNAYRRRIASWYDDALHPEIVRVPHTHCESSRHLYQIRIKNRDEMLLALNRHDIFPGVHYVCNRSYPPFQHLRHCPHAETIDGEVISLPLHLEMTQSDVIEISQMINTLFISHQNPICPV